MMNLLTIDNLQLAVPTVVILLLLYFVIRFWIQYRRPAKQLQRQLRSTTSKVIDISKLPASERRHGLASVFQGTALEHSWLEFQETLHDQHAVSDGENRIVRTRATAPSSYFFGAQKVIDTPLKTEYFRHLPGILTGIGIIGTFMGLLIGLSYFDPSDPAKVQESLKLLLTGVRDAFIASSAAIISAMFITNSEKKNLRLCIEYLEGLTDAIDRMFDAGVGEEYLSELVRHTQESSVQTRLLKDSLVTDLREMLQNLVDTQVRENLKLAETLSVSYKDAGRDIAANISESIESSFREPLEQIARSVQTATGDQSGKVQTLLQDVLVAFMQKIEGTFGTQFNGMQEMLSQSIGSMQQMQTAFVGLVQDMRDASESSGQAVQDQLARTLSDLHSSQTMMQTAMNEMVANLQMAVANIGSQGEQAGSKMGEQLQRIFEESEARQQAMASQMQSFVDSLKESVGKGQNDTMQRIAETVEQLGTHLSSLLGSFEKNRSAMDVAALESQQAQQAQLSTALNGMCASQEQMQRSMNDIVGSLQATVTNIGVQGEQAGEKIGQQLEKQFSQNEIRQQVMAGQLDDFVRNVQETVGQGHQDAMQQIASTVDVLSGKLGGLISSFENNRKAMDSSALEAQQQLQAGTTTLLKELSAQVKTLLTTVSDSHEASRQTIKLIGDQTERNLLGMQVGADKMRVAANDFTTAGNGAMQVTQSAAGIVTQIQASSSSLLEASTDLVAMLGDYRESRVVLEQTISTVERIVGNAQSEAGMRGQVLVDLQSISERMQTLNGEAQQYLDQVTGVLASSFENFGSGVERSLMRSLASFDAELDTAIKALGGGVNDLSENLETFGEIVEKSVKRLS